MDTRTERFLFPLLLAGFVLLNLMTSKWQGRLALVWLPCFFAWTGLQLSNRKQPDQRALFRKWMEPYWLAGFALLALSFVKSLLHAYSIPELSYRIQLWIRSLFVFSWNDGEIAGQALQSVPFLWILPLCFFSVLLFWLLQKLKDQRLLWFVCLLLYAIAGWISSLHLLGSSILFIFQSQLFLQAGFAMASFLPEIRPSWKLLLKCLVSALLMLLILWKFDLSLNFMSGDISGILPGTLLSLLASFLFLSLEKWLDFFRLSFPLVKFPSISQAVLFVCLEGFWMEVFAGLVVRMDHAWMRLLLWPLFFLLGCISLYGWNLAAKWFLKTKEAHHKEEVLSSRPVGSLLGGLRDQSMDLLRAFLILSMLVGHAPLDESARAFIFSYHMPAFILSSGWFYKPARIDTVRKFLNKFWSLFKTFVIPYLLAEGFWLLVHHDQWSFRLSRIALALGFLKNNAWNLDQDAWAIGPVYFLLVLFLIRLFALILDTFCKDWYWKLTGVLLLCVLGLKLGEWGDWLFWSLDIALACLPFYYLGYGMKKLKLETLLEKGPVLLYGLGILWMLLIGNGSFEIAVRNYGFSYGFALLSICAAFLILYFICRQLNGWLWPWLKNVLALIGRNTLYILLVHSYFGWILSDYVLVPFVGTSNQTLVFLLFWIIQSALGVLLGELVSFLGRALHKAV